MSTSRLACVTAALGCLCLGSARAHQDDPHAACAAMGWVPREVLERPSVLR